MAADALIRAAEQVNFVAAARVIAADPERDAPAAPAATVLALAFGVLQLWQIVEEAELVAQALRLPAGDELRRAHIRALEELLGQLRRVPPITDANPEGSSP